MAHIKSIASLTEDLPVRSARSGVLPFNLGSVRAVDAHHACGYVADIDEVVAIGGVGL